MTSEELEGTTFKVYLYLMKAGTAIGPREVMRGIKLSSPSVAYRHLQKLMDLGLVNKDKYGNYLIQEKTSVQGFLWIGRTLLSRLILYSFFFMGILVIEIVSVTMRLIALQPIGEVYLLLITVTGIATTILLFEGIQLKRRIEQ